MYKCSCAIDAIADQVDYGDVGRASLTVGERDDDRRRARRRHARPEGRAKAGLVASGREIKEAAKKRLLHRQPVRRLRSPLDDCRGRASTVSLARVVYIRRHRVDS